MTLRRGSLALATLLLSAFAACEAATAPDPSALGPGSASLAKGGSHPKATGGVKAQAGTVEVQLDFNAHGTDPAKGNVLYRNSLGGWFRGSVSCYLQEGNAARFSGPIEDGTYSGSFVVEVQDNGQGSEAAGPDRIRVLIAGAPDCSALSGAFPGTVTEGNLTVH